MYRQTLIWESQITSESSGQSIGEISMRPMKCFDCAGELQGEKFLEILELIKKNPLQNVPEIQ